MGGDINGLNFVLQIMEQVSHAKQTSHTVLDRQRDRDGQTWIYFLCYRRGRGPGSIVSIVIGYGLDGPGIESLWDARFSAHVQTGPGDHPASRTMGTGSFPGVKGGRGVTLTPHLF